MRKHQPAVASSVSAGSASGFVGLCSIQLSYGCKATGNTPAASAAQEAAARFLKRVDSSPGPDACWPWPGTRNHGYGVLTCLGVNFYAHRVSLEIKLCRPLAEGEQALHDPRVCNNPPCVNPAHLRAGTPLDNATDRVISGTERHALGEAQGSSKLTEAAVLEILAGYRLATVRGSKGQHFEKMAAKHGVTRRAVELVAHRQLWAHVGASR